MQTLTDIWKKRKEKAIQLRKKAGDSYGSEPYTGFGLENWDGQSTISTATTFGDNWSDLSIMDFRLVLDDLLGEILADTLDADKYSISSVPSRHHSLSILESQRNATDNPISIISYYGEDQPQFTIYHNGDAFSVSWYKSRGRIDSIINLEYGHPITLEEFTDILVSLGLEEPYTKEDDE